MVSKCDESKESNQNMKRDLWKKKSEESKKVGQVLLVTKNLGDLGSGDSRVGSQRLMKVRKGLKVF